MSEEMSASAGADLARWKPSDIRQMYRLILHREAESDETVAQFASWPVADIVRTIVGSPEFEGEVVRGLSQGLRPWATDLVGPADELLAWAARALPLSEQGRRDVLASNGSWSKLYLGLAVDPVFSAILGAGSALLAPSIMAALQSSTDIEGGLEEGTGRIVRGWVFRHSSQQPVLLELWVNGVFCAAGLAERFRREVQDRFGGNGLVGFEIAIPEGVRERFAQPELEVRVAGSQIVIGRMRLMEAEPPLGVLAEVTRELNEIRRLLEAVETRLPAAQASLATPLSDYDTYAALWRGVEVDVHERAADVLVLLDAVGAPASRIDEALVAVLAQTHDSIALRVIVGADQSALAEDMRNRCQWRGFQDVEVHIATDDSMPADRLTAVFDAHTSKIDFVLVTSARGVIAPGALRRIARELDADEDLQALYFDEDRFAPEEDGDYLERRRVEPQLKSGFDRDLLLQTPYVGPFAAFRPEALRRTGLRAVAAELCVEDALLRMGRELGKVGHLPRVLATLWPSDGPTQEGLWLSCASDYLRATESAASASFHADELGAAVAGAARIRYPLPIVKAAVIIATKDGVDLLKPCMDSLLARRSANRTEFEVIVVDHESKDPEAVSYLQSLRDGGLARVIPFAGPFNWALINNLAAAQTDAEVLVFLNNDTLALTEDGLDELVSQAMRPEVAVVGCRLLYGDGTIQHAGFVAREEAYSFLVHEGVGRPGAEPGYLGRHSLLRSVVAVTGACMAVRAEVFRRLGGFDAANFPIEGNDVDLCMRAKSEGFLVLYDPYVTLYHLESKTRGFNHDPARQKRAEQASRLLWRRWGKAFSRDPGFNAHFDRLSRPFERIRPLPAYVG